MAWVLVDDNLPNHPKVVQAEEIAKGSGWLFICALCYCRRYHTGGFIPRGALPTLGAGVQPRRMVEALIAVRLFDEADAGFAVHDYDGFYADEDDKAKRAAIRELRRDAGRKGGVESAKTRVSSTHGASAFASSKEGVGRDGVSDHFLEEKKREADFANFWQAYPRKDGKQAAKTEWMRLKPTDDQQRQIAADLERRKQSTQWMKDGGQFIPHARTYLHQRRFEDGFTETPRLTERTLNVIKGFGAQEEIA